MSHEFYQIMVGSPTMSIYSWKQLALWSLEYSCLDQTKPGQIETAKVILNSAWHKFCRWVVDEYGDLMDGDMLNKEKARKRYGLPHRPDST
jgi:adenosine deaminase CECR1